MTNRVFIATSLDGYISGKDGDLSWLESVPNPNNDDMGYNSFIESIDAILMGRITFETVCSFECDWPYKKPVFVISNTLNKTPAGYEDKIALIN
jgi:dihydrofolate reductase